MGIEDRRSVRLEDPGRMVQTGYTAGARGAPAFDWVRNLLHSLEMEYLSEDSVAASDYLTSCLFALGWNIIRAILPDAVIGDWVDYLRSNGMPAMDAGVGMTGTTGDYSIRYGDESITFHDAELAPVTGLLNYNYSRAIHHEAHPHRFAVQWIIGRTHGQEYGGHFYISSYGVRIINTTDTMIAWRPTDKHGTSLANFDPGDPDPPYGQFGICYCTSTRLATVLHRYGNDLQDRTSAQDDDRSSPVPFAKRWTARDEAAAVAAQEFLNEIVAGVLMDD
ncbi:hypothetical protein NUW54_g6677 [Trametes sanguinea]|uniref:Uncharacterized protein n=1 Tax=Trametes sanguinea TaxID=158606 RepID=A0ACC1PUX2_9APHY|nr:hypothetical protein NUW54_g6677 [Trametes sanguinea]